MILVFYEFELVVRVCVFEYSVDVELLMLLETASEKLHPLLLHFERIEAVINVLRFYRLEELHQFALGESVTYVLIVVYKSKVNLRCVSRCLRDV